MKPREIVPKVYSVGAIDWDRRLFDALIPLPDGTSYNSYLILGSEKTALIDTVDPTKQNVLIDNLNQLGIDNIDYIIANHAEQDHSGTIPVVLEKYPGAQVVCTPRCQGMLVVFGHKDEPVHIGGIRRRAPDPRRRLIGNGAIDEHVGRLA